MDELLDVISNYANDKIKRMKIGQIFKTMPREAYKSISDEDIHKYEDMAVEDYFALRKVDRLVGLEVISEDTANRLRASVKRRTMLNDRLAYIYLNEKDKSEVENITAELAAIDLLLNRYHILDNPFNPAFNSKYEIINEWARLRFAEERTLCVSIIDGFDKVSRGEDMTDKNILTENRAKRIFYLNHINTPEEQRRTDSLLNRLYDFVRVTDGDMGISDFKENTPAQICYRENVGYIGIPNDSNHVMIHYYGNTEEDAFLNILNVYEWDISSYRSDIRYEMFQRIHPGSNAIPIDSRANRSQVAIMQFGKFYGDNIPEIIIEDYKQFFDVPVTYDSEKGYYIKAEKNATRKLTPEGDK